MIVESLGNKAKYQGWVRMLRFRMFERWGFFEHSKHSKHANIRTIRIFRMFRMLNIRNLRFCFFLIHQFLFFLTLLLVNKPILSHMPWNFIYVISSINRCFLRHFLPGTFFSIAQKSVFRTRSNCARNGSSHLHWKDVHWKDVKRCTFQWK